VQDFDMLRRRVNVSRSVTESGVLQWSTPKVFGAPFRAVPHSARRRTGRTDDRQSRDDLVFSDLRGGVLRNSNWRARVFRPAVEKCQAGDETFPTITPHDLRHTAASLAVSASQRQSRAADVGTRKGFHDSRYLRRPVRRRPDEVADRLNDAIRATADALRTAEVL
jgi:integrase